MERLSARLAAKLEREILAGRLPPGERLPSEEKLCQRFDASRTVIREAIQQLRGRGLLRTLKGSGTFIADPSLESLGSAIQTYSALAEAADFHELIDFRIVIESECARLSAAEAGERAIVKVRAAFAEMERAAGDRAAFAKADIAFHRAIAEGSGNRIYATLLGALEKRCIDYAQANRGGDDWFDGVIEQHQRILDAIEAGNADSAWQAMRRHLLESRRRFVDVEAGQSG
jgi:DNA-binding FadR family transcriptional regulator